MRTIKPIEARITEEACLAEVLRLQVGDDPCPACEARTGFVQAAKHRSFACRACGFKIFPCVGTPFAKAQPSLREWFLAIYAGADEDKLSAKALKGALDVPPRIAEQLADGVEDLKASRATAGKGAEWVDAIRSFVEDAPQSRHPSSGTKVSRAASAQPASGSTPPPPGRRGFDRWGTVGIAGILCLALLGAGVGWLLVPDAPEEDSEVVQATAILSLANDKPVLIVSQEVADQLYDVQDVEAEPNGSAMPSIRLAPPPGTGDPDGTKVAEAKPLSVPSIKLAPSVGQSILSGDLSAVRGKASQRPELAAYDTLAKQLEAKGPRNPDELIVFGPMKIRWHLVEKIYRAALKVQMDPILLMAIADKESSFATEVQAKTSSATGLFQFIERTWLGVVRDFGAAYGLEREAKIAQASSIESGERTRILELRSDAFLSAAFAGEMLKRDALRIGKRIGRPLTGGEIYLVHFLGPDGAEKLIERVAAAPTTAAAELLPKPAEANKTIFYAPGQDGAAKKVSVSELKEKFDTMISVRLDRYRNVHGVALGKDAAPAKKK